MSVSIADQYFVKALDNYSYDLADALENVNYALSYNDEHAGAHCLMGKINYFNLSKPELAQWHFDRALSIDFEYVPTYEAYSIFLILRNELEAAEKLLDFASKLKGINLVMVYQRTALIQEKRKNYVIARKFIEAAREANQDEDVVYFLDNEFQRVKTKAKNLKKKMKRLAKA